MNKKRILIVMVVFFVFFYFTYDKNNENMKYSLHSPYGYAPTFGVGLIPTGTTLPSTCNDGERFFKTDTDTFYICEVDSWTSVSGGGGGNVSTSGTPVTNDIARFTGTNIIEGRSYSELKSDLNLEIGIDVAAINRKLDDFGTPDDNTDLNATTSYHGLLPKLDNNSAHFLNGQGSWATPGGGGNVSSSGTPSQYDWATWTDATTIKGVTVTGNKVVCTDANGEPVACSNLTDVDLAATYQPLESTLTDIADGTIAEDLVNTAHPWGDNEVADDITASNYAPLASPALTGSPTVGTSIDPDTANGATIGSATKEWSDIFLAAGGVIYGENDQSNTITSSASGWTFNLFPITPSSAPTSNYQVANKKYVDDNAGSGDVSKVGTPSNHQFGIWTGDGTLKGLSVTASKLVGTDANGEPTAITTMDLGFVGGTLDDVVTLDASGNFQEANPEDVLANGEAGRGDDADWEDYSGTSTIVGWTGETANIWYRKINDIVYVQFRITGTSNATTTTFTLPYTSANRTNKQTSVIIKIQNNGATPVSGLINIPENSATATCYPTLSTSSTWTASGNKLVIGEFWYEGQ